MKKLALLLLLTTTVGFSQNIEAELGTFTELKILNGLHVTLKKATYASIEISGNKAQEVVYKNKNGKLKLSMRLPETFNADDAKVTIYYSTNIDLIDANEGALLTSENKLTQEKIVLKVQEGAIIDLDIDVKFLTAKSVSGGSILLKGNVESQDIEANTGGTYKAYELKSTNSTITCASGSLVKVTTSDVLDVKVRFGGTIYYKGNPAELKTEKIIGGTIESKD